MKHFLSIVLVIVLALSLCIGLCSCKPDGPQPGEEHKCESKCPTCGKCTDAACKEEACKEKCPSHSGPEPYEPKVDPTDDNYRVFYQIFVGSFSDSNGDGIGDIRGIINRMDYLNDGDITSGKSLGVQGLWLSPIFKSPSYHKYDAADYYQIDPKFGTDEDLKELLTICHQRNVKVILDLAINHSSSQNAWFRSFREARRDGDITNPYYNYYTCVRGSEKVNGRNFHKLAGTDDWWYEGNFSGDMPELNYDNEAVRQQMVDVAKHWLDMGVDGFRFDAIKYIYYNNTADSAAFWDWYIGELKKINPEIYTVGECWSGDSEVVEYYSALNCFNFTTSGTTGGIYDAVRNQDIDKFTNYVERYQQSILAENSQAMYCPFLANHDMDRAAGFYRVSFGEAYMAANVYLLCCGSPFIYYGEEIGMFGTRGSANTDANRRLAMLWGDEDTVKNPEGSTFKTSQQRNGTVAKQLENEDSLLNHYAKVIALRLKYPEIARGVYTSIKTETDGVGGFKVVYNDSTIAIIHNTSADPLVIDLPEGFTELCDFVGLGEASVADGKLTIGGRTTVILK